MLTERGASSRPAIGRPAVLAGAAGVSELDEAATLEQWLAEAQLAAEHPMSQCVVSS